MLAEWPSTALTRMRVTQKTTFLPREELLLLLITDGTQQGHTQQSASSVRLPSTKHMSSPAEWGLPTDLLLC